MLSGPSTHPFPPMQEIQVVPLEALPSVRRLSSGWFFLASPQHEHKPWQQHSTSLVPKMALCFSPRAAAPLQTHAWPEAERNDWDRSPVWALSTILGEKGAAQVFEKERDCSSPGLPAGCTRDSAALLWVAKLCRGSPRPARQLMYFTFHVLNASEHHHEGLRDTLDPFFFIETYMVTFKQKKFFSSR